MTSSCDATTAAAGARSPRDWTTTNDAPAFVCSNPAEYAASEKDSKVTLLTDDRAGVPQLASALRLGTFEAGEIASAVSRDPETRYDDDDLDELELLFKRRQLRSSVRGVRFLLSNIRQLRIHLAPMLYARIRESCPTSGSYG
jgi:hypothetical protein